MRKIWKKVLASSLAVLFAAATMGSGAPIVSTSIPVKAASTATVNVASQKQVIRGFGASSAWCGALSDKVMDSLYKDCGFSILRVRMEPNEGWNSNNYSKWADELSNAKKAEARGAIVFATPWSAPASMKSNNSVAGSNGATLKSSSIGDYANYLKTYANYFKSNGAPLYAISLQNEPDWPADYDGCKWTAANFHDFIATYGSGISSVTKIMMPESLGFNFSLSDSTLNDANTAKYVSIIGGHLYGATIRPYALGASKGKDLWMTEHYTKDLTIGGTMDFVKEVHDCMTTANMNAYVYWWINNPENGMLDSSKNPLKRAYALGQYAKFVRNGYHRVDATPNLQSNVYISAYTGDNKVSIVAINKSTSALSQSFAVSNGTVSSVSRWTTSNSQNMSKGTDISVSNGSFTAQLPAQSITTFVGSLNGAAISTSPSPTPSVSAPTISKISDGWYYIKNVNAQKYLQVKDNTGANVQNVEISTGTGAAGQKWYVTNTSDGYLTLKSALGDYMIDIANGTDEDGANAQIYSAYSGTAQKFALTATSTQNVYSILTACSSKTKALDVYNFGKTDGTNVCQWTYTGGTNQQWVFEKINTVSSPSPSASTVPSIAPSPSASISTGGSTTAGLPSGISCEYSVISDWGSSFQGQIVLTNNSSKTYNGWTLKFDYASTINSLWGAELSSQSGNKVTVTNPSWDTEFAPGESVTINFTADGTASNAPVSYSFS